MSGALRPFLFLVFVATGFYALTLQVNWKRVLSPRARIDLLAVTIVAMAFMGGLGLGCLARGALPDRAAGGNTGSLPPPPVPHTPPNTALQPSRVPLSKSPL